jgi:hypothetical protein
MTMISALFLLRRPHRRKGPSPGELRSRECNERGATTCYDHVTRRCLQIEHVGARPRNERREGLSRRRDTHPARVASLRISDALSPDVHSTTRGDLRAPSTLRRALLVDLWDELVLARAVRAAWLPLIDQVRAVVDVPVVA